MNEYTYEHMRDPSYMIYRFNVVKHTCIYEHMRDPAYVIYPIKALQCYSIKALIPYSVNTLML